MPRLIQFRCWWCGLTREARELHHEVEVVCVRRCCDDCYHDPTSTYNYLYDGMDQEYEEVMRVRGEHCDVWCRACNIWFWKRECERDESNNLACPRCLDRVEGRLRAKSV